MGLKSPSLKTEDLGMGFGLVKPLKLVITFSVYDFMFEHFSD